jgi:hypothetical protein
MLESTKTEDSTVEPKTSRRVRYNQAMRLVRRSHLYAGLFMTPWVFLYGITALLFNHPEAFPDQASRRIESANLAETKLGQLPTAEKLAGQVVEAIDGSGYRLVRPGEASFSRELAATARSGGRQYNLRIDLETGQGMVREVVERPKAEPAPFATRGPLRADEPPPLADPKAALVAVLAKVGLPASEVTVRTNPELGFLMEGNGRTWRVQYDLATGAISGRPEDAPGEPLSSRRFLTRLHLAHGYPGRLGVRWGWAVAVDLMFASMVGWGITGLLMWWQMKNVRRIGLAVLAMSAVVATMLAVGMHESLTSANASSRGETAGTEKPSGRPAKSKSSVPEDQLRRSP